MQQLWSDRTLFQYDSLARKIQQTTTLLIPIRVAGLYMQ